MGDSFYVMLRNYLRVDEVIVRIMDTRIYHAYGTDYLIRDFQHKEATYDDLRKSGFKISSEWSLSQTQHDEVNPSLTLLHKSLEKITLSE